MNHEDISKAEVQLRKDGYIMEANLLHELVVELRVVTRAYDELYELMYPGKLHVFAHIK